MRAIQLLAVCLLLSLGINAQNLWNDVRDPGLEGRVIKPSKSRILALDFNAVSDILMSAPMENTVGYYDSPTQLSMPMPNGEFETFAIVEAPVMAPELTAKFPSIRSFIGVSVSRPGLTMRCDISHHGFHAIFHSEEGTYYIDPLTPKNLDFIQVYTRSAFYETNTKIFEESEPIVPTDFNIDKDAYDEAIDKDGKKVKKKVKSMGMPNGFAKAASGTELRTYRLALSGTGEYTAFHGGTVADGLAAMNTSMTRVNFVYEREVAIRMVIIANNDLLVFTDGATDPFTNGNGGTMLNENQTTCDNIIGSANYDIGHVYSTGGGGIAQLFSPCSGSKARGVTGQGAPINDPFDIDYVAHEMGHQFGGNHTQNNSCNRSTNAAFEPGSASTIMGYAGICAPNLQSNSDAYFHNHSYNEMINFSQNSGGNTCPVITNTGNSIPTVTIPAGGWVIPASTPFELTASGSDADGDVITFNWEEYDLGPATSGGSLATASGTQPIFRSWTGTTDPTRTFPRLSNLLNNTVPTGELLPYYSREMNFRCTVRDNRAAGGGVNDAQLTFDVSDVAGPFILNAPNTNVTWPGLTVQTVTWDVANTDIAPVNCSNVDIYLSTDGGQTFPTLLVAGVANDGSQDVFIPDSETSTARIKVKGANNIFFDISNTNFTIGPAVGTNDNDAGITGIAAPAEDYCGSEFIPEFTIINQGVLALTSLDISYDVDGGTATVINWTGNLASGQSETIVLAAMTASAGAHTFNVVLSNPNGTTDDNLTNNSASSSFSTTASSVAWTLDILTDNYPGETTWEIIDTDNGNAVIASGGPYAGTQTSYMATGCSPVGCYQLNFFDSFGDGMQYQGVEGSYTLTDEFGTVLAQIVAGANFGSEANDPFCLVLQNIDGCTNSTACNFDPAATNDDGSCILPDGCTDNTACNFDPTATCDDGSCILPDGCTNNAACNFDPTATCDDGSCLLPDGCTNNSACNFDPTATCDDGSCILPDGCTNNTACNFDPTAVCDDGSCILPDGCTDNSACNFSPTALCDDGSCEFISCLGCTNNAACNFDPAASIDDGSCILPDGCTNNTACNFDPLATCDDGSCILPDGCTNNAACNYDATALCDDGSCILPDGCTDNTACNFDPLATCDDGSCILPDGCTNNAACNYDPLASCDDGSCIIPDGCTNNAACNFDPLASCDDGSCILPDGCTDDTACNYDMSALCDDGSCEFTSCVCQGDFNNDGNVDVSDLLMVLADFGCTSNCTTDMNQDGAVNGNDILSFLGFFGTICD